MARVSFRREELPPGECLNYPGRATPVYVPKRRCELAIPSEDREHRNRARDTIFVSPDAATLSIQLDDGSGLGFPFPQYVENVYLCLARKGYDVWSCVLPIGGIEAPNTVIVRLEGEDWRNLPAGYYDAQIRFNMGALTMIGKPMFRGWLLLYKEEARELKPVRAEVGYNRIDHTKPCPLTHPVETKDDV